MLPMSESKKSDSLCRSSFKHSDYSRGRIVRSSLNFLAGDLASVSGLRWRKKNNYDFSTFPRLLSISISEARFADLKISFKSVTQSSSMSMFTLES